MTKKSLIHLLTLTVSIILLTGCTKKAATEPEVLGQCSCTFQCFRTFGGDKSVCGKSTRISATIVSACQRAQKSAQSACGFKFDICKKYSSSPPNCENR